MRALTGADDVIMSDVTFHGSIVSRAWIRGAFWDRVDVDRERITLRPWLRRRRVIDRGAIDAIGFETVMLPLRRPAVSKMEP